MSMNLSSVRTDTFGSSFVSAYIYGKAAERFSLEDGFTPAVRPKQVELEGNKRMDVVYQYRYMEGWQGDVPVSMTYLVAKRAYSENNLIFTSVGTRSAAGWVA